MIEEPAAVRVDIPVTCKVPDHFYYWHNSVGLNSYESEAVVQPIKKIPHVYRTLCISTEITVARHLDLARTRWILFASFRFIFSEISLIVASHIFLNLARGRCLSGFPTRFSVTFLIPFTHARYPTHRTVPDFIALSFVWQRVNIKKFINMKLSLAFSYYRFLLGPIFSLELVLFSNYLSLLFSSFKVRKCGEYFLSSMMCCRAGDYIGL